MSDIMLMNKYCFEI